MYQVADFCLVYLVYLSSSEGGRHFAALVTTPRREMSACLEMTNSHFWNIRDISEKFFEYFFEKRV